MTGQPAMIVEPSELVARTRAGDEGAFTMLVERYQPVVFRWALAMSGDEDAADDITQEVFVRVYRKLGNFRGEGSFEGWLFRITRRVALRLQDRATTRIAPDDEEVYVTDPGGRVDRQRAIQLITAIGNGLPMRQREVFVLCDVEGRSPAEVAVMLDMKDVSVRASLFKARTAIRRTILATHPCYREQER